MESRENGSSNGAEMDALLFLKRKGGEERSMPEEFQNPDLGRTVQEVIIFCSTGGITNQLQNRVMQTV